MRNAVLSESPEVHTIIVRFSYLLTRSVRLAFWSGLFESGLNCLNVCWWVTGSCQARTWSRGRTWTWSGGGRVQRWNISASGFSHAGVLCVSGTGCVAPSSIGTPGKLSAHRLSVPVSLTCLHQVRIVLHCLLYRRCSDVIDGIVITRRHVWGILRAKETETYKIVVFFDWRIIPHARQI